MSKLFSFGIVADVQYGDVEPHAYEKNGVMICKSFRTALNKTRECVNAWNKEQLAFCVQLGDIIEGRDQRMDQV